MVNDLETALSASFAALADPTRRAILARLARGPATVGELGEPFAMSAPAISKHLRVLEQAGLLERTVEGRVHRIALETGPLLGALKWLERQRLFWGPRLDALGRHVERRPMRKERR